MNFTIKFAIINYGDIMEKEKNNIAKKIIKPIGVIILYFFISSFYVDFLLLFGIHYSSLNNIFKTSRNFILFSCFVKRLFA